MQETLAFVDALVNDKPSPCSGEDGLVALLMAIAAGTSAEEQRWVEARRDRIERGQRPADKGRI